MTTKMSLTFRVRKTRNGEFILAAQKKKTASSECACTKLKSVPEWGRAHACPPTKV